MNKDIDNIKQGAINKLEYNSKKIAQGQNRGAINVEFPTTISFTESASNNSSNLSDFLSIRMNTIVANENNNLSSGPDFTSLENLSTTPEIITDIEGNRQYEIIAIISSETTEAWETFENLNAIENISQGIEYPIIGTTEVENQTSET